MSHQSELGPSLCYTQDAFSRFHIGLPHSVGKATICLAGDSGLGVIPKTPSAFIDVVLSSASDIPVAYPSPSAIPSTPPPSRAQLRAARRLEHKLRFLDKLNKHLEKLESEGFLLIFTDGFFPPPAR